MCCLSLLLFVVWCNVLSVVCWLLLWLMFGVCCPSVFVFLLFGVVCCALLCVVCWLVLCLGV